MKTRKLRLSKETVRSLRVEEVGAAVGGSRVRCGPGTYADSCFNNTCISCVGCGASYQAPCHSGNGPNDQPGDTCYTCPI